MEEHKELVKEGEKWMKDKASSCTVAAALIATVVFAAAITAPGGNKNEDGYPNFSKQKAFVLLLIPVAFSATLLSSILQQESLDADSGGWLSLRKLNSKATLAEDGHVDTPLYGTTF
ncbi:hypothetical protein RCOM_0712090 [Ricinus communis]|uniref:PGG domain-containing protein n=1 Tax=Ricinus communis TaxID=3988 RepID=B9RRB3_RICCO|nr:hypothetical protein RCOM_0712090 [Ricinus communis]